MCVCFDEFIFHVKTFSKNGISRQWENVTYHVRIFAVVSICVYGPLCVVYIDNIQSHRDDWACVRVYEYSLTYVGHCVCVPLWACGVYVCACFERVDNVSTWVSVVFTPYISTLCGFWQVKLMYLYGKMVLVLVCSRIGALTIQFRIRFRYVCSSISLLFI